ncbi:MAG TPA: ABC transporter permease [Rhodocyclaceae bacterium]|nr:ABC transporter permease [Rhodocyclaceae bacterium]
MNTQRIKLATRNLLRHKLRSMMTLTAIVFGVTGLILAGGFVQDVLVQLGEATIHSQTGHIQIFKRDYLTKGSRYPERYLVDHPEDISVLAHRAPEVTDVMSRLTFSGSLNNGKRDLAIIGEGVEPAKEAKLGSLLQIVAGNALTDSDAEGILIGEGVAASLALKPDDHVTLLVATADGAINTQEFRVAGVFRSFSKDYDARAIRIQLAAAQELLLTQGVNLIVVSLRSTRDTDSAQARLVGIINNPSLEIKTWRQLSDFYDKTVALYQSQFGVLQWIILIMVLLSVSNSVNMSIMERVGEFGTARALGDHTSDTFKQVVLESTLLGLFGAALGAAVGMLLATGINQLGIPMPPPPNSSQGYVASIRFTPWLVFSSALIGLIGTILASLFPAWKVSRIPVVEALRQNV